MICRLFAAAVLLWASSVSAQVVTQRAHFQGANDLDATSYTYCIATGNSGPLGTPFDGRVNVKTTGSSTTITAVTVGSGPFDKVTVGDILFLRSQNTTPDIRYVTAKTSADTVTVNSAINIENSGAGRPFGWYDVTCGTSASDGWMPVSQFSLVKVLFRIDQMNATSIDAIIEGRDDTLNPQPTLLYPDPADAASTNECKKGNFTDVNGCAVVVTGIWDAIRIGFKINTDDGSDTGADAESITASINARR